MAPVNTTFHEQQKFNQWWLWLILLVVYLSPLIANIGNVLEHGVAASFSVGIWNHIVTIGLVIILFLILRLKTTVDANGIHMHYFPLLKKEISWEEIAQAELVHYSFREILGWGIRFSSRYGTVYNVRGKTGLAITLTNGKKFMIGTQKPEALQAAINAYQ